MALTNEYLAKIAYTSPEEEQKVARVSRYARETQEFLDNGGVITQIPSGVTGSRAGSGVISETVSYTQGVSARHNRAQRAAARKHNKKSSTEAKL